MKRTNTFIFILLFMFFLQIDTFAASCAHGIFTNGSGSANDPWIITNIEQFKHIEYHLYDHYIQVNDINANGITVWNQIPGSFEGTYNGNNYSIYNINSANAGNGGLFNIIGGSGVIKNLKITGSTFNCDQSVLIFGSLARGNYGTISNCHISGISFTGYGETVGGVVGDNGGLVTGSSNYSNDLKSSYTLGGIVGTNLSTGVVRLCYNYGNLTLRVRDTGGVVGTNYGLISECANYGRIEGWAASGGILGINVANNLGVGTLQNSYNAGIVFGGWTGSGSVAGTNMRDFNRPEIQAIIKNTYDVALLLYGSNSTTKDLVHSTYGTPQYITNSYNSTDATFMSSKELVNLLNSNSFPKVWKMGNSTYPYPVFVGDVSVSLATSKSIIGDNTYPLFTISYPSNENYILRISEPNSGTLIYQGAPISQIPVNLDNLEGDLYFICDIIDSNDWSVLNSSNIIHINKKNILNQLYGIAAEKSSLSKVLVLNDSDRILDDNPKNRELVEKIKQSGQGIYFIGKNLSPILYPLFEY